MIFTMLPACASESANAQAVKEEMAAAMSAPEEAGTEKAFEFFVAVICMVLAWLYMKINNG